MEKGVSTVVKKLFEKDDNVELIDQYAEVVGMDDANKRVLHVFKTQGTQAGIKAMMTREDGTAMTYAESRAMYG
jgi:hypothetical protein